MRRRPPGAGRHARQRRAVAEPRVRNARRLKIGVELLDGAHAADVAAVGLGRMLAARVLAIRVAGATGDHVIPRDDPAVGIEAGPQPLHGGRAVVVVLQVALAVVDHHHGAANRLGDHRGFGGVVRHQPPPESAADARGVHVHLVGGNARRARHDRRHAHRHLDRSANPHLAIAKVGGAVVRLERGVRHERERIGVVDDDAAARQRIVDATRSCAASTAGAASSFWNWSVSVALLSLAYGPSSHWMTSASRPLNAAQVESATTATPGMRNVGLSRPLISTMSRTPGTWRALVLSILIGRPLKTGHFAIAANFMPGMRTSMPNSPCAGDDLVVVGATDARADQAIARRRP